MIVAVTQSWGVAALVGGAAGYLAWSAWRFFCNRKAGSCCARGCSAAQAPDAESPSAPAGTPFVPLENLVDQARRKAEQRSDGGEAGPR